MKIKNCILLVVIYSFLLFTNLFSFQASVDKKEKKILDSLTDLSLEALLNLKIVTATKYSMNQKDVPASVTVITSQQIRQYGWRNLAELLKAQTGFDVFGDRIYRFIVSRGFYQANDPNSRILLLINGHSVVESFGYYNGHLPTIDINFIDRIEIVRGPNSVLYGTNAMFAVINIITGQKKKPSGLTLFNELGNFGHNKFAFRLSPTLSKSDSVNLNLYASFHKGGKEILYFDEYDNAAYPSDGFSKGSANLEQLGNLYLDLSYQNLHLHVMYNNRKKHVPTGLYGGRFNDDRTFFQDINGFAELKYSLNLSKKASLDFRLFTDFYQFKGRYMYYADENWITGPPYESEFNEVRNRSHGGELLYSLKLSKKHMTIIGAEYKKYARIYFRYYSENDPLSHLDEFYDMDPEEYIWSVYATHSYRPVSKLIIEAGLHYNHYHSIGGHSSFRSSISYRMFNKLWIKLLYGEALRAPNTWELRGGFFLRGNPDLKPEVVKTLELIFDASISQTLNWKTSIFRYDLKDNIRTTADYFDNIEGITGTGFESYIRYLKQSGFHAYASISFSDVKKKSDSSRIPFSARWLGKAGLTLPLFMTPLKLGIEFQWVGPRLFGDPAIGELTSHFITNLTLSSIQFSPQLELSLTVRNLFNSSHQHPSFISDLASWNMNSIYKIYDIPAEGRSIMLKTRLNL